MLESLGKTWSGFKRNKNFSDIAILISSINIALTAFTNLEGILSFARFIHWISEKWRTIIHSIVESIVGLIDINLSVDVSVFWFLYVSFITLCALSFSRNRIPKSDLFDSLSLGLSFTFFIIFVFANESVFIIIFSKSGYLAMLLKSSPAVFIVFMGALLSLASSYKGRSKKMGFYVYQSSKLGIVLGMITIPIAIDLLLFTFAEGGILFNWLLAFSRNIGELGWERTAVAFTMIYLALIPSIFACGLFFTNHAIISKRFAATNFMVGAFILINYIFVLFEKASGAIT